jgi:hypothetical protein
LNSGFDSEWINACRAQDNFLDSSSAPEPTEPKTVADWMKELTGVDITRCPHCGTPLENEQLTPQLPPESSVPIDANFWDTS